MHPRKKIAIVLPNLMGGGAERLAIYLANEWAQNGYAVDLILTGEGGDLIELVAPTVHVKNLRTNRIRDAIRPVAAYLRTSKADIIWAGMWPLTSASVISWAIAGRPGKLFLIDHIHVSISAKHELDLPISWIKIIMRATYPFATGVMAVSKGVAQDIRQLSGLEIKKIKVINNPASTRRGQISVGKNDERTKLWKQGFQKRILSVGSLKTQKNHSVLIDAFARVSVALNAQLVILGEGHLRSQLERKIQELGLEDRISMPGFYVDPTPWFRTADIFVLSSDWEGLPTVLIEALEWGLPIVSTDCPSGPAEILDNGRFGRLVPVNDVRSLAANIEDCLSSPTDHEPLIQRSKDFSVERISKEYLTYFDKN